MQAASKATKMQKAKAKARAYQSITPANNMILKRKWDQSRFDMHRMKVRNAKPMIDNKPPETYMHLHLKLKKRQMEEERQGIIERDNRILLQKMGTTMRTEGRVDNKNMYKQRSLNTTRRQRDLLRVTHENQAILKRIQSKEPHYNHMQWLEQWRVNKGYMANISKYPHTWMHSEKLNLSTEAKGRRYSVGSSKGGNRQQHMMKMHAAMSSDGAQTIPPISA